MNKIANTKNNSSQFQTQQKVWKSAGYAKVPQNKESQSHRLQLNRKIEPTLKEKKFSVFFDQIHKVDELAEQLKQSQVVEVQDIQQSNYSLDSPINSILNSKVHNSQKCTCKAEIKKLSNEIVKFKSFHEEVEKKSRAVNSMLQVMSVKDKKPQIVQQIFQKLYSQIYQSTSLNTQNDLLEQNKSMKQKLKELEQNMMVVMQKNIELEHRMEYYEHELSEVKKSRQSSEITKNRNRVIERHDRFSRSIESEDTNKTYNFRNMDGIVSPKSSATKRFIRTSRMSQNAEFVNVKQFQNTLRIDKKTFSKDFDLRNTCDT